MKYVSDLKNQKDALEYLNLMLYSKHHSDFLLALYNIVLAQDKLTDLMRSTGLSRSGVYKCLRPDGNPSFKNIIIILKELGFNLYVRKNIFYEPKSVSFEASLERQNPKLAQEWHLTENFPVCPKNIPANSKMSVWWRCPQANHVWKARVDTRQKNSECPICLGYNEKTYTSLANRNPQLASEWHPTKNGNIIPDDVTLGSGKKAWWVCSSVKDHVWQATIVSRAKGSGCPACVGKKVAKSNCLATTHPKLAKQWHPTKNGTLSPFDITAGSSKRIWWKCIKSGDHEWIAVAASRSKGTGCPFCSNESKKLK